MKSLLRIFFLSLLFCGCASAQNWPVAGNLTVGGTSGFTGTVTLSGSIFGSSAGYGFSGSDCFFAAIPSSHGFAWSNNAGTLMTLSQTGTLAPVNLAPTANISMARSTTFTLPSGAQITDGGTNFTNLSGTLSIAGQLGVTGNINSLALSGGGGNITIATGAFTLTNTPGNHAILSGNGTGGFTALTAAVGDTVYGGSAGAGTRLAGNTAAHTQYYAQTGTGSASAAPAWQNGPSFNVRDYGAVGDGSTDDTPAIAAALTAAEAVSGAVYFPTGVYACTALTYSSGNVDFYGDGPDAAILKETSATAALITGSVSGGRCSFRNLQFATTGTRTTGNPLSSMTGFQRISYGNVIVRGSADIGYFTSDQECSFTDCNWKTIANPGYVVRFVSAGFLTTKSIFLQAATGTSPAIWIQGTSTSHNIVGGEIDGCGALYSYAGSAVSVSGSTVTATISSAAFSVGEVIVFNSGSPSSLNGYARVTSVNSTTVVATSMNAQSSSGTATVTSIPCALEIDNAGNFPVNESLLDGVLFSAVGSTTQNLTAAIYVNGLYSPATIEGWAVENCYFDQGSVNVVLAGYNAGTGDDSSVFRWIFSGCHFCGNDNLVAIPGLGAIWVNNASDVTLANCQGLSDAIKSQTPPSSWVYAWSGGNAPFCVGLKIIGCSWGNSTLNSGTPGQGIATYGITFDGTIADVQLTGNTFWGQTAAANLVNTPFSGTSIVTNSGNIFTTGTALPTGGTVLPDIASSTTISPQFGYNTLNLTGTTTVQTINPLYYGQDLTLLCASGVTFGTSGNILVGKTVPAGGAIHLVFRNPSWYIQ